MSTTTFRCHPSITLTLTRTLGINLTRKHLMQGGAARRGLDTVGVGTLRQRLAHSLACVVCVCVCGGGAGYVCVRERVCVCDNYINKHRLPSDAAPLLGQPSKLSREP